MTVTKEQAQQLTALAVACRPPGAPTWDAAGVMSAIGQVRHLALAEVALATIRAARDRDAKTPGVIAATTSIHWAERITSPPVERDGLHTHELCSICLKPEPDCRRLWATDHDFERNTAPEVEFDTAEALQAMRALVKPTAEPVPRRVPTPPTDQPEHVQAARRALPTVESGDAA